MTNTHEDWCEVADRIQALALKLKLHAEEELAEVDVSLPDVVERIGTAVSAASEALADAARDEAIRQDLRDVGSALRDAISNSLHAAGAAARASTKS
jgi:hypothetical protein